MQIGWKALFLCIIEHISCTIEIHAQITDIWKLGRKSPQDHMARPGWHNSDGRTLGSRVHFQANIPPIHHPCSGHQIYLFGIFNLKEHRTQDHGAGGKAIGYPTTIHTNITATSFTLLGTGLRSIDIRYGLYRREDRSQAHDVGEVTVAYLVIVYYYTTAMTYRLPAVALGRNLSPPGSYGKTRVTWFRWKDFGLQSTFSQLLSHMEFFATRTSTRNERLLAGYDNPSSLLNDLKPIICWKPLEKAECFKGTFLCSVQAMFERAKLHPIWKQL